MLRKIRAFRESRASIEKRLMITNIWILIVPMLLLFMTFISMLTGANREENNRLRLSSLSQRNAGFENLTSDMTAVTNTLYHDTQINQMLSKDYGSDAYGRVTSAAACKQSVAVARSIIPRRDYDLMILGVNGINTSDNMLSIEAVSKEPWYARMEASCGELIYISRYDAPVLSREFPLAKAFAVRKMVNLLSGRYLGLMIIRISSEVFEESFSNGELTDNEHVLILDGTGRVLFSAGEEAIDWEESVYYRQMQEQDAGVMVDRRNERIVTYTSNDQNDWYLVSCEHATFTVAKSSMIAGCILIICLGLSLLMSRYNAKYIRRRTQTVVDALQEVVHGNLHARLNAPTDEEFLEITTQFNEMLDRIEMLLSQVEAENREKLRHELDALRSQINPHFLNNTIASIRYMILEEKYEKADTALVELVKLFRGTFSEKREIITIGEELDLLESYVQIMKIRYEDSFEYKTIAEDAVTGCGILAWTLQPFVENSISHGFNQKKDIGHITIRASLCNGCTVLCIEDDGIDANLDRIHRALDVSDESIIRGQFNGIGIQNVQSRIKKRFGYAYGIDAWKNEMGGITFRIRIPAIQVKGEHDENSTGR